MTDTRVSRFAGRDGHELAFQETGEGRPLILLHGFMGTGSHWLEYGTATGLAEHGRRLVLPDLRAHGANAAPDDPAYYPQDVLVEDLLALIEQLGVEEGGYDLGGYSLGARVATRALARGARPGRAMLAGQGLSQVSGPQQQSANYRTLSTLVHGERPERGTVEEQIASWVGKLGHDPRVLLHVLDSLVPTPEEELRRVETPALVVIGAEDHGHNTADALAAALPQARFLSVPGDHGTALSAPEFIAAFDEFFAV
jgi:pimeloyl-ACP methyl ester carboxylesterase